MIEMKIKIKNILILLSLLSVVFVSGCVANVAYQRLIHDCATDNIAADLEVKEDSFYKTLNVEVFNTGSSELDYTTKIELPNNVRLYDSSKIQDLGLMSPDESRIAKYNLNWEEHADSGKYKFSILISTEEGNEVWCTKEIQYKKD